MKKTLTLLLVLCMVLSMLAACGNKKDPGTADTTPPTDEVTSEPTILDDLPKMDLGGKKMRIMAFSGESLVSYELDDKSDQVSTVAFRRTEYVNQLLNVELSIFIAVSADNKAETYDRLQKNELGDGKDFEIAMPHPTEGMAATLTEGFGADLLQLNNLTLDGEWYHQSLVQNYQTNGKLYLLSSDFTVAGEGITALVYNTKLYTALGGKRDLYQTVKDGDWTLDIFMEEIQSLTGATGTADDGTLGTYALGVNRKGWEDAFIFSCDIPVVQRDSEYNYTLTMRDATNREKIDHILSVVNELSYETKGVYRTPTLMWNEHWPTSELLSLFKGNSVVFMPFDIGSQYPMLNDVDFEMGYLPYPKLDTYQEGYRTGCSAGYILIPAALSKEDQELSAAVVEALARYSNLYTKPAFYSTVLKGNMAENMNDYEMLDLIHKSKYFTVTNVFDGGNVLRGLVSKLVDEKTTTCESYFKKNYSATELILTTLNTIE